MGQNAVCAPYASLYPWPEVHHKFILPAHTKHGRALKRRLSQDAKRGGRWQKWRRRLLPSLVPEQPRVHGINILEDLRLHPHDVVLHAYSMHDV